MNGCGEKLVYSTTDMASRFTNLIEEVGIEMVARSAVELYMQGEMKKPEIAAELQKIYIGLTEREAVLCVEAIDTYEDLNT